jgi:adenosylcobinamide-GDP ribazoletransferase
MSGGLGEAARALALAAQFLTRAPLPVTVRPTQVRLRAAMAYLPLVGALIGAIAAVTLLIVAQVLPVVTAVLASVAATCVLTGALHEDGLADTLDGAGGGADAERALAIMRDSRIGVFGALGLGLVLAVKVSALAAMPLSLAAAALVAGHAASRASCVVIIATSRYVRPAGAAGFTAQGLGADGLALALATGCVVMLAVLPFAGFGALGTAAAGLVVGHLLARRVFEARLGGYTGDCLGATQQLSEVGFYLGVLAWL